jgi:hypothetical protein
MARPLLTPIHAGKLREGLQAAHRTDALSVEGAFAILPLTTDWHQLTGSGQVVYELSFVLAILFSSQVHANASLGHLPTSYAIGTSTPKPTHSPTFEPGRGAILLLSLLNALASFFPSQNAFQERIRALPQDKPALGSRAARTWISSLAAAQRSGNYFRLSELVDEATWGTYLSKPNIPSSPSSHTGGCPYDALPARAARLLLGRLLELNRTKAWKVVRSAYPRLSCGGPSPTRPWLERTLILAPDTLDEWLHARREHGEVEQKDDVEGLWIVVKKS